LEKDFSPGGPISFSYRYRKSGNAGPVKEWVVEPQGMTGSFNEVPYPVRDIPGIICVGTSESPLRNITFDLPGKASDGPVLLHGRIHGEKDRSEVVLDITTRGLPLDERIHSALPVKARQVADQFVPLDSRRLGLAARPMGRADAVVAIRRKRGSTEYER